MLVSVQCACPVDIVCLHLSVFVLVWLPLILSMTVCVCAPRGNHVGWLWSLVRIKAKKLNIFPELSDFVQAPTNIHLSQKFAPPLNQNQTWTSRGVSMLRQMMTVAFCSWSSAVFIHCQLASMPAYFSIGVLCNNILYMNIFSWNFNCIALHELPFRQVRKWIDDVEAL